MPDSSGNSSLVPSSSVFSNDTSLSSSLGSSSDLDGVVLDSIDIVLIVLGSILVAIGIFIFIGWWRRRRYRQVPMNSAAFLSSSNAMSASAIPMQFSTWSAVSPGGTRPGSYAV